MTVGKRKLSNGTVNETKRLDDHVSVVSPSTNPDFETANGEYNQDIDDYSSEDGMSPPPENYFPQTTSWQKTITKVVKSVVSIQFSHVSNFDTESSAVSEATGFVVDSERGYILTNRHVVGPGPFCGYVVFDNHEEAVVRPIYRDPIHDFGFLQFDPKDIRYMKIEQLDLRPDLAQVGTEIRVVGNDAGEKLSILAGFISRLDRNAPDYGTLSYNDFNTEYIQAAASASGGSSGSPVVNKEGYAVALQAGGSTEASTDFFLPVYRPLRALQCIQQGQTITRGDIQVEWQLKPFDECRRLGLTSEAEAAARSQFPDKIGLLVAELVLPEGPADGKLKEGDTLISINGTPIASFISVDEILDEQVGNSLKFVIQRNGHEVSFDIVVGDLHSITPSRYVDIAGASFNDLSYQIARCFCIPVRGVFINDGSGSFELSPFEKNGWLLEYVDDKPTPNLDAFVEVMKSIPDRKKVSISYKHVSDFHTENITVIYVERHWQSTFRMAVRNDSTGLWDFTDIQDKPLPAEKPVPQNAKYIDIPFDDPEKSGCSQLTRSFVQVRTIAPVPMDSYPYRREIGYGVVVDAANGYVLVSRRFVPHDMCDIFVIFAESVELPGKVVFLHPNQNYAIVKYDPQLMLADVKTPKFSDKPLKRGERAFFVGYNYNLRVVTDDVKVSSVSSINVPVASLSPRYRGTNLECILLDSKLSQECDSGVLADYDGTLRAFWITYLGETNCDQTNDRVYRMGLDVTDVLSVIKSLHENKVPAGLRILDAEFASMTIFQGRLRGVPQEWISKFEEVCEDEIKFLAVDRVSAPALGQVATPLKTGDIVMSVNDSIVKTMRDLGIMYNQDSLDFVVIRQKKELRLNVPTIDTSTLNTSHVVFWCGSILQAPHHGVRQLIEKIPSEIYVTKKNSGGPANQYGIATNSFITHVNDTETKTLESFVSVVKGIPDNTYIKLRLVSFDSIPVAISVKTNYHYFPTFELKKVNGEWEETEHKV
ncbi:Pro-apoptotic serine protease [Meyerozyma sp. JA9]|nr:Pro-apoptotic serine protease [Meyerozyma sp. JA9]